MAITDVERSYMPLEPLFSSLGNSALLSLVALVLGYGCLTPFKLLVAPALQARDYARVSVLTKVYWTYREVAQ